MADNFVYFAKKVLRDHQGGHMGVVTPLDLDTSGIHKIVSDEITCRFSQLVITKGSTSIPEKYVFRHIPPW
jgi:hypothetical protein